MHQKYISKDPFVNVYLSTLKIITIIFLDMNIRLGKMNFAISSFDKLYEALLLKGDVKEAYYYGLLLNYDVNNVAMFYSLSDIERKNIEYRVADYLKRNTKNNFMLYEKSLIILNFEGVLIDSKKIITI